MKYVCIFALLFAMVLTGCNKDQRTNRRIDGRWDATVFLGTTVDEDWQEVEFTLNRDERGEGTGSLKMRSGNQTNVFGVTYFIKNDHLTMLIDEDPIVFTIVDVSRKRISLTDSYGEATLLEKD